MNSFAPMPTKVVAGLGAAVLAISSAAIAVRLAGGLDPALIAAGRVAITGVGFMVLAPRALAQVLGVMRTRPRAGLGMIAAGILLAAHFGMWITSLRLTTVLESTVLVATQPLFAAFLARGLGERAPTRLYVGTAVAMGGTAILVGLPIFGPSTLPAPSETRSLGNLLALAGALAMAGYLTVGRGLKDALPLRSYLAGVHLIAAIVLTVFWLVTASTDAGPGGVTSDWLAVVYLGLVPGLVGHGLFNWAVRFSPVYFVSLAALLEPVGASLLAWWILAETAEASGALGASVILVGIGLAMWRRRRPNAESPNDPA